jgi:hypothetical protein
MQSRKLLKRKRPSKTTAGPSPAGELDAKREEDEWQEQQEKKVPTAAEILEQHQFKLSKQRGLCP